MGQKDICATSKEFHAKRFAQTFCISGNKCNLLHMILTDLQLMRAKKKSDLSGAKV
jgi:hypothetical protein